MEMYNPHLRSKKTTSSIMRDVCIALLPATIGSVVFFGMNALFIVVVSVLTCVMAEGLWQYFNHQPIAIRDYSAVVTGLLIAFNVSSTTPLWVVILGDVFAIICVKQFFGGIGSNVFNPALIGRLFMMLVYPSQLMTYATPMQADVTSSATLLTALKSGGELSYSLFDAFIGKVPGALGETSVLLLLIGFAYLVYKREVNVLVTGSFFATVLVIVAIAGGNPLYQFCSGGLVLGGCFMLTDYNFASSKGHLLYGVAAGIIVGVIRMWGMFPEGVCYAILIVNSMSVIISQIEKKHVYGLGGK